MSILQALLYHVHHYFIGGLRLSVGLRMSWCSEGKLYAPILAEIFEIMVGELMPVVCDELVGDSKACDNVYPQEFPDLVVRYAA